MRKLALGVERRGLLSAIIALVLCLSAALWLLASPLSDRIDPAVQDGPTGNDVKPVRVLALTAHDPIFIDGNAGFTNASGVTRGSGTESDPYVIADWDISAAAANGIWIQNTDAHFIVRNCSVQDGYGWYNGIVLSSCVNGILENNNCSNDGYGIILYSSSNNTLSNNTCSSNSRGIYLESSSNNALINNTCSDNDRGIDIPSSNNNMLIKNNCSDGNDGMMVGDSSNNTLIENICNSNYYGGIYVVRSSHSTLINNTCKSNRIWGIYLWSSDNNSLSNNNCSSNNEDGMILILSNNNTLSGNNCSSNGLDGIALVFLPNDDNDVCRNSLCSNVGYGVNISSGSSNRIWNNIFINNNGTTDTYNSTHVQARDDGSDNWWNSSDDLGNYWSDWTTPDVDPPSGIVDLPYNISGSAGAKDYYPLTATPAEPIPEFAMMPLVVMVLLVATILTESARRRKAE